MAFFNVPSAVGLAVVGGPIVSLIYQHGRFGAADAEATAQALACYALGLYAYSAVKVMAPAFYALDRARVPVVGSILGMVVNVGLNVALYPVLGFRGVALGTSLAAGANLAVLMVAWRREYGGLGGAGLVPQLARVMAASAVLAVVAWGTAAGAGRGPAARRALAAGRGRPGSRGRRSAGLLRGGPGARGGGAGRGGGRSAAQRPRLQTESSWEEEAVSGELGGPRRGVGLRPWVMRPEGGVSVGGGEGSAGSGESSRTTPEDECGQAPAAPRERRWWFEVGRAGSGVSRRGGRGRGGGRA